MIQFTEEEIKAIINNLADIPAKFSIALILHLEQKLKEAKDQK